MESIALYLSFDEDGEPGPDNYHAAFRMERAENGELRMGFLVDPRDLVDPENAMVFMDFFEQCVEMWTDVVTEEMPGAPQKLLPPPAPELPEIDEEDGWLP